MTSSPVLYPDTERDFHTPVWIRLLGTMELGDARPPTARLIRRVLALLAMHPGGFLAVRDIARELWDDDLPRSWATTVQTYIMRLRQVGGVDIETRPCGYALMLSPMAVDVHRFVHFADQARRQHRAGDAMPALDTLRAAFSLWRGSPLIDVPYGPLLADWVQRVEEKRRSAMTLGFMISLDRGGHRDVVEELLVEWRRDRCREDTAGLLMVALYRSQRQVDALSVFRDTRRALAEEHGIDPCPELRLLQQQILRGDASLELNGEH